MNLGLVPASSSRTFTLDHTPQFIGVRFNATGTVNSIQFTGPQGLQVNLNEAAIKAVGQALSLKELDPLVDIYFIPVAAGFIGNESTSLNISTGAGASGVDIYVTSLVGNPAGVKFNAEMKGVLANGNAEFSKFSKLILIAPGATDVVNIQPADGTIGNKLEISEIQGMANMEFNNATDIAVFNNTEQTVGSIVYNPVADRTVVRMYMSAGGSTSMSDIADFAASEVKRKVGANQKLLATVDSAFRASVKRLK